MNWERLDNYLQTSLEREYKQGDSGVWDVSGCIDYLICDPST